MLQASPYIRILLINLQKLVFKYTYNNSKGTKAKQKKQNKKMSYSRVQIQNIIARNKKRNNAQKSPSPPLSPKSIAVNRSNSPKDMTIRYQELCAKYKTLLEDVKDKNHKFQLQEAELDRLKSEKQRDQKQLYRLRSIIGFIKKQDKGLQVNMDMQSTGSWSSTKIQKSTAIEYQNDIEWHTPVKQTQSFKLNRKKSPTPKQFATSTTLIGNKNSYKTHTQDMYDNYDSEYSRVNTDTLYSPKNSSKEANMVNKMRESREVQSRYNKLSNSPYSRLRFSRNM